MAYLSLRINGELWAEYPVGLHFPSAFKRCYPMRGSGKVSYALYLMNKFRLDRLFLGKKTSSIPEIVEMPEMVNVAFFWPAASRSTARFYGYKVVDGEMIEYVKIGRGDEERRILRQEAKNTMTAKTISNDVFEVASCLGILETDNMTIVRYQCLPGDVQEVPINDYWLGRIDKARCQIASAGYQHGDFGWHNLKVAKGKLWVLDWEEMSNNLPKLVDEISFVSMLNHYNRGFTEEEVWKIIIKKHGETKADVQLAVKSMASRGIAMGVKLTKFLD